MNRRARLSTILAILLLLGLGAGSGGGARAEASPIWQAVPELLPSDVTLDSVFYVPTGYTVAPVLEPYAVAAGSNSAGQGVLYELGKSMPYGFWVGGGGQPFRAPLHAVVTAGYYQEGWVVGDKGLIAHQDGLGKWHEMDNPLPTADLYAIQMFGMGEEGWAAGALPGDDKDPLRRPALLHYKDGKWQADNSISGDGAIYALHFAADGGWAVGDNHLGIWHYSNGGWGKESIPEPCAEVGCYPVFKAVRAVGNGEAWAVGSYASTCGICVAHHYVIHRSSEGKWQNVLPGATVDNPQQLPMDSPYVSSYLDGAYFSDANNGVLVGSYNYAGDPHIASYTAPLVIRYKNGKWSYDPTQENVRGVLTAVYMGAQGALAVGAQGLVFSYAYGNHTQQHPGNTFPTGPVADPHDPLVMYFAATGHTLRGAFREYWLAHGGLAQFGYPLTEESSESSYEDKQYYTVQYFERNRFEFHPELPDPYKVSLGLLGRTITTGRESEPPFQRTPAMMNPVAVYFGETGHNMMPPFLDYWQQHGGLAVYGYPISEAFTEVSKTDGKAYTVQYFERNRFEYHPELPDPYKISLGLLGREVLQGYGWLP